MKIHIIKQTHVFPAIIPIHFVRLDHVFTFTCGIDLNLERILALQMLQLILCHMIYATR